MQEKQLLRMIQDKAKQSIKSFDIGKFSGRHPDSIRFGMPEPSDSRFEHINSDLEKVSKFSNTKATVDISGVTSRQELWGPSYPQPDVLNVEKIDKAFWLPKASTVISNKKIPGHQPISP